mmetsp:Transcript_11313/g.42246  ORF Transcript_11313/g.42246 Transcript_11313/m.42246 type:complete len:234 (+) Transcript_11313:467-1168(+)
MRYPVCLSDGHGFSVLFGPNKLCYSFKRRWQRLALEVGVLQRLGGIGSQVRIERQELHHQCVGVVRHARKEDAEVLWCRGADVIADAIWQQLPVRPRLVRGRAQRLEDALELIRLIPAHEQRGSPEDLPEDASGRPHVDSVRILPCTQEQLRRAVPDRHDLCSHELRRAMEPRQPKVGDLHDALVVDEQVGRLQIPMQDEIRVAVLQPLQQMLEQRLAVARRQELALIPQKLL